MLYWFNGKKKRDGQVSRPILREVKQLTDEVLDRQPRSYDVESPIARCKIPCTGNIERNGEAKGGTALPLRAEKYGVLRPRS